MGLTHLAGNNGIVKDGKTIFPGTLVADLVGHTEIPLGGGMCRKADAAGSHEQRAVSFHDIDHLLAQRDFHDNLGRILRFVGRLVIGGAECRRGTTAEAEHHGKKWEQQDRKESFHPC